VSHRDRIAGFTLVELMVTVAIIAILASLAAPSFSDFIRNQRIKNASFDLVSDLTYARSEAVKRNGSVTISAAGGGWNEGWSITIEDGTSIRVHSPIGEGISSTGDGTVEFNWAGRTVSPTQITLTAGSSSRCISVSLSGMPSASVGACS